MNVQSLSTPALVVDLDILERNLERMQSFCNLHGLHLRPHIKTHKSLDVARRQLQLGSWGAHRRQDR